MSASANVLNAPSWIGPAPAASCSAINSSNRPDFCASDKVNTLDSLTDSTEYDTKHAAATLSEVTTPGNVASR
jgi:hypothetical protein